MSWVLDTPELFTRHRPPSPITPLPGILQPGQWWLTRCYEQPEMVARLRGERITNYHPTGTSETWPRNRLQSFTKGYGFSHLHVWSDITDDQFCLFLGQCRPGLVTMFPGWTNALLQTGMGTFRVMPDPGQSSTWSGRVLHENECPWEHFAARPNHVGIFN